MLIRGLGGLGFCYPVTAVSPCSPVPSEIWDDIYLCPRGPPPEASLWTALLTSLPLHSSHGEAPAWLLLQLGTAFSFFGWPRCLRVFCESNFKIIWNGLMPNAHICHLLKGFTVLHNFLSVFNFVLMVQGNYCKGHTFINWNHKYFVGVLIKWGDLRFKWQIESFWNSSTAHLGKSQWKNTERVIKVKQHLTEVIGNVRSLVWFLVLFLPGFRDGAQDLTHAKQSS